MLHHIVLWWFNVRLNLLQGLVTGMVVGPMIADVFDMEVAGDLCSVIPLTDIDNDAADTRLAVPINSLPQLLIFRKILTVAI